MLNRREWFGLTIGAAASIAINPQSLFANGAQLIRRAIPSTGEKLPIMGLGSSATFAQVARSEDVAALKEVIRTMVEGGATVLDTAPAYGASEQVAGSIAQELGVSRKIFWATKVNVAGRGADAKADPAAAREQIESSFAKFGVPKIDLIQVHNLADVPTHLSVLAPMKKQGRVRYVGVTSTSKSQYPRLVEVMRNEPIDFIGVDYAVDNRDVEETILPLAAEKKIAVLVYLPFGRTRLFQRTAGKDLPGWATELGVRTWAQFFLKYVMGHPAVTVVTPATSKPSHMAENIEAGTGRLPDAATRKRMADFIDAL
ncbi:MAG TPA: aldo/keto reductase [Thermoanaerobaculia bacterium]|nr:aldo/keto reductase [Thermoanaerobaculia bacterium]